MGRCCPPTRECSSKDRLRLRGQLRLGSGNRRKTNTEEPNSVEKGAHRRKAPASVRVCFDGAGESAKSVPPTSLRSREDRLCLRGQLRLGSGNRRKTDTEEPNSVEKGAHRRNAPAPVRVCFAGAGESAKSVPPTSRCSTEDRLWIRAQLRLTFACRRRADWRHRNSVEKGAHRRKAPVPVRVCVAGAGASAKLVPPGSRRSSEDRFRPRTQLRLGSGNRRRTGHRHPTSDEGTFVGAGRHRRAGIGSLCKIFLTSLSHFPLQIIPTGVLLSADNRNLKTL